MKKKVCHMDNKVSLNVNTTPKTSMAFGSVENSSIHNLN
jgi:hypothetical protein